MDYATQNMPVVCDRRLFPGDSGDFIKQLLNRDPALRLGAGGVTDVKHHPYFDSVDWVALEQHRITMPRGMGSVTVPPVETVSLSSSWGGTPRIREMPGVVRAPCNRPILPIHPPPHHHYHRQATIAVNDDHRP